MRRTSAASTADVRAANKGSTAPVGESATDSVELAIVEEYGRGGGDGFIPGECRHASRPTPFRRVPFRVTVSPRLVSDASVGDTSIEVAGARRAVLARQSSALCSLSFPWTEARPALQPIPIANSPAPGEDVMFGTSTRTPFRLCVFVLLAAGCSNHTSPRATPSLTVIGPEAPTDANIAAYLLAASNTDLSYARIAAARARHQAVREFATRMLTDHGAANG